MKAFPIKPLHYHRPAPRSQLGIDDDQGHRFPPLGFFYVADAAKDWTDLRLFVTDCQALDITYSHREQQLRHARPCIFGKQDFVPPVWTEHLSRDELLAIKERAHLAVHLRPRVFLSNLARVRPPREFLDPARAGLGIISPAGSRRHQWI